MKTIKKTNRPFFDFNTPIHQILLNNLKFYILICLIILTTALVFTACSEDEESYDNVPKELQNTAWGEPVILSFTATTWTRTNTDDDSYFTVSDLKVAKIPNTAPDTKDEFPSGYEIRGKIIESTDEKNPVKKIAIYQFFISTNTSEKKREILWGEKK